MDLLAAAITGSQVHYEKLTANIIFTHLDRLNRERIKPTHLFVTEWGNADLTKMAAQDHFVTPGLPISRYMGMDVVVLPGLPENTLLMGTLNLSDK